MGEAGVGTDEQPDKECDHGDRDNRGNEDGGDLVHHRLDRGPGPLGVCDHVDDPREHRLRTECVRTDQQRPGAGDGTADDLVTFRLGDRQRLTGDHGLVDRAAPLEHGAVHRDLLSGTHPDHVADLQMLEVDLLLVTVVVDPARGRRRQIHEGPDGPGGGFTGPQFQDLPQCYEGDDDRGRLEVDLGTTVHVHGLREDPGEQQRDDGV